VCIPDKPVPEDLIVDKDKFDALLRKIVNIPALTPEENKQSRPNKWQNIPT
jgi:hypothetical protein